MPMKPASWDNLHERFEMKRSTTKKPTALTAPAPIGRKSISAACAAPKSASTITLLARICSAMRRKSHGGKITAASRMAIR